MDVYIKTLEHRADTTTFHPSTIGILLSACIIHEIKLQWDPSQKQEPVAVVIPNHDDRALFILSLISM